MTESCYEQLINFRAQEFRALCLTILQLIYKYKTYECSCAVRCSQCETEVYKVTMLQISVVNRVWLFFVCIQIGKTVTSRGQHTNNSLRKRHARVNPGLKAPAIGVGRCFEIRAELQYIIHDHYFRVDILPLVITYWAV